MLPLNVTRKAVFDDTFVNEHVACTSKMMKYLIKKVPVLYDNQTAYIQLW